MRRAAGRPAFLAVLAWALVFMAPPARPAAALSQDTASALIGLWLGYAPPASLSDMSEALLGAASAEDDPASPGALLAPLDFGGLDV